MISLDTYKSIFENTGTGMIIIEENHAITLANQTFCTLVNRPWPLPFCLWTEFVAPEDRDRMIRYHRMRRQDSGSAPTTYTCRLMGKNESRIHVSVRVSMIPDSTRSVASFSDISIFLKTEAALRKQEAQFKAMIDHFSGYLCVFNRSLIVEYVNQPLIRRLRCDATGMDVTRIIPLPELRRESMRREVFGGKVLRRRVHDPEDDRWYDTIAAPIFDATGIVQLVQVMMTDATEQQREAESLRIKASHLRNENRKLRSDMGERYRFGDIVGKSTAIQKVYEYILKAAASTETLLITGESGTGKELVAQAVHKSGRRKNRPFIAVNCGAIAPGILESEFFGYKKGAFSGAHQDKKGYLAMAHGATLFLDEIGEMGMPLQVKLLRALEYGEYFPLGGTSPQKSDFRLIAATNRDLTKEVREGRMREDFFYRINILAIHLPPLRERREDIPLLVDHFVHQQPKSAPAIPPGMMEALLHHDWPGNVRELQHTLQRFFTLHQTDLPNLFPSRTPPLSSGSRVLSDAVAAFERQHILKVLEENNWQKARTATILGIHRKTLFIKMRDYGLM
ncbi:sigma 54-interacting transcriptional regulator [Desulfobotulus sp. H1]|uniref:Sigma 54-interacting transcriptional regulator n=1 Tax=Desulfobotulus pelophilus TaxID=2823377 RepID=A0ABT3NAF8_9BACT|nr:sigma 54-interacting transcriptional regulator [Desulfobotulus pelophilus]MCW7754443.1 sigma 54-interacting transcriptional regulator [Desulfobotulus pelophilus]